MFGERCHSVRKPTMKRWRLTKRIGTQSKSCVSAEAIMLLMPSSPGISGQPSMGPMAM